MNASVGVLRGYLANAEKVRVRGVEFDGSARVNDNLSFYGAAAYTDGKYVSFPDAPPPLEDTGGPQVKDISGSDLPGISKWALSLGGEYVNPATLLGRAGRVLRCARRQLSLLVLVERDAPRSIWWSTAIRCSTPGSASGGRTAGRSPLWSRNLLDKDYFELLSAAPGNSGLYRGAARRSQNRWRDPADDAPTQRNASSEVTR